MGSTISCYKVPTSDSQTTSHNSRMKNSALFIFSLAATTNLAVKQKIWSHLVLFGWMTVATSGSVMRSGRSVMFPTTERVCSGSTQCITFSSCSTLQGRNKQDTLKALRQLQCGFSGSSPKVCCPAPSLPRKAVEGGGNPAVVNVDAVKFPAPLVNLGNLNDVNVNSNLDNRGLHARTGNFPLAQEETTLWSEEFGPK